MGTELMRASTHAPAGLNAWRGGKLVREVHRAYVRATAEVLLTNTFLPILGPPMCQTYEAGVRLAKTVAASAYVLLDIGPTLPPDHVADVVDVCRGVDGILLETLSEPSLIEAFTRIAGALPCLASFAFGYFAGGQLRTHQRQPPYQGLSPEECARIAFDFHVAALGVNCGRDIGKDEILEIIRRYRSVADLPLFVRPNAGTPKQIDGQWVYPKTPERMAAWLPELFEAGVVMVGGCCGTTPAHIAAFRKVVDEWNASHARSEAEF